MASRRVASVHISITRQENPLVSEGVDPSDGTHTYRVTENRREYFITVRSNIHGLFLGLRGHKGFLYTDTENNRVYRQVLLVGGACGMRMESDEVIEGLSALAIRGVLLAESQGITGEAF